MRKAIPETGTALPKGLLAWSIKQGARGRCHRFFVLLLLDFTHYIVSRMAIFSMEMERPGTLVTL